MYSFITVIETCEFYKGIPVYFGLSLVKWYRTYNFDPSDWFSNSEDTSYSYDLTNALQLQLNVRINISFL